MDDCEKNFILNVLKKYWNADLPLKYYEFSKENIESLIDFVKRNRIEGYFYKVLVSRNSLKDIYAELFERLEVIYNQNVKEYSKSLDAIDYVCYCLIQNTVEYAFVNGSYLIPFICECGLRIQKDIDILISKDSYEIVNTMLLEQGFVQTICKDGICRVASRLEKIVSLKNNREIIPYFKSCADLKLGDIWVDIDLVDISCDCFANMIEYQVYRNDMTIPCLKFLENFAYICHQIYKKSKSYMYTITHLDVLLYRYCELYQLLNNKMNLIFGDEFRKICIKMHIEKEIFFVLTNLLDLFDELFEEEQKESFLNFIENLNISDLSYINQVYDEKKKNIYVCDCTFIEWVFMEERLGHLKKIS